MESEQGCSRSQPRIAAILAAWRASRDARGPSHGSRPSWPHGERAGMLAVPATDRGHPGRMGSGQGCSRSQPRIAAILAAWGASRDARGPSHGSRPSWPHGERARMLAVPATDRGHPGRMGSEQGCSRSQPRIAAILAAWGASADCSNPTDSRRPHPRAKPGIPRRDVPGFHAVTGGLSSDRPATHSPTSSSGTCAISSFVICSFVI